MYLLSAAYCQDCQSRLTLEERYYYETRCEMCEREFHERIRAWREGGDDEELEKMFGTDLPKSMVN